MYVLPLVSERKNSLTDTGIFPMQDHEGWPGNVISQVHNNMFKSVAAKVCQSNQKGQNIALSVPECVADDEGNL